uniref:WASH complex subunit 4 (Trinotate prediction) n=1 Tax=Henneguya salminicola TaxID=69463 RepID=A0A6G3MIC4_HENSL
MSEEDKLNAISLFKKTIKDILIQKIVIPVSIEIENYLRINNYNDKNLNDNSGFNNFNKLISLEKIRIYDEYFSFSSNVTEYLERKIFTHTIICPFEYRNYENMRQFYQNQLGIPMLRTFLPVQQVDHGIDAGEILQNIDSFIEDYSYNLQNQIFVQRYS